MLIGFRLVLLFLFGVSFCVPACGPLKDEGRAAAKNVVDCTTSTALQAIEEYSPTLEQVLVDRALPDGTLDRDHVKSVAKRYASEAARCVLAATFKRLMTPPSGDAPQSAAAVNPFAASRAWEELRARELGGATFKLPGAS
jgi:hypothetical protein